MGSLLSDAGAAVYIETYMQTMHQALENSGSKLTNTNDPISKFLTPAALLTAAAVLTDAESAALTPLVRERVQTLQLSVFYPVLLRWSEMRAYADGAGIAWPFDAEKNATLNRFVAVARLIGLTNLMEPDSNYHPPIHDLDWFVKIVNCNCSWVQSCCQSTSCCGSHPPPPTPPPPPSPPPPQPPSPAPPAEGPVRVRTTEPPTLIFGQPHVLKPSGMAKFAQTLCRFPDGQLLTNFETSCDVCAPKLWYPGRTFFSATNGSTWIEIPPFGDPSDFFTNGAQVWKSCTPYTAQGLNALKCFAYLLTIDQPEQNRTGNMMTTQFEVSADGQTAKQTSVYNASVGGWPATFAGGTGLVRFKSSGGNWNGASPNAWCKTSCDSL